MKNNECRRAFTRIPTRVSLELRKISSGETLSGYTQAVSMNGFAIEGIHKIPIGEVVEVDFLIEGPDSGTKVEVKARIANVVGYRMGAEILSHLNPESYCHLEKLVLYRSGDDADVIVGEIERHKDKA